MTNEEVFKEGCRAVQDNYCSVGKECARCERMYERLWQESLAKEEGEWDAHLDI